MEIFKIVIISICGVLFIVILNKHKDFGIYLSVALVVIIFFLILDKIEIIMDVITQINSIINIDNEYIKILLQILGIAFITEF